MVNDHLPISVDIDLLWKTVENSILTDSDLKSTLSINGLQACLEIKVDPGTGLSRSGEFSRLTATLQNNDSIDFTIRNADPIDQITKLFSNNKVSTGIASLDKRLVVKSNNSELIRKLFGDSALQTLFNINHLVNISLHNRLLEVRIDTAIINKVEFEAFYRAFVSVSSQIMSI